MKTFELPTEEEPVRMIQGDCADWLDRFPTGVSWQVLTDPPYGISLQTHSTDRHMNGKTVRVRKHVDSTADMIQNDGDLSVVEHIRQWADDLGIPLAMFGSPYKPLPGKWRNILVWDKGNCVGAGGDMSMCWKRNFELIYVARNRALRGKRDGAILRFPVATGEDFDFHPCQKPVKLLRYLIRQITDPDDVILDPCMGSGSTLVAALLEGRRAVGIEIDPKWYRVAEKRMRKHIGYYRAVRGLKSDPSSGPVDLFGQPI